MFSGVEQYHFQKFSVPDFHMSILSSFMNSELNPIQMNRVASVFEIIQKYLVHIRTENPFKEL